MKSLHKLMNLARKNLTTRQLRWFLGRPLFDVAPALRRHYAIATRYVDITDTADLVHDDRTETRIELSSALVGYFKRFEAQTHLRIDGRALILPHRFHVFRLRRVAQLAHTGIIIDQVSGKAVDRWTAEGSAKIENLLRNKFRPRRFRKIVEIVGPAMSLLANNHFAHFILEDFRKIVAALEAVPELRSGSLIVPDAMPAYQRTALGQLAQRLPDLKIVEVGPDVRVEFDALHVPMEPKDHNLVWFARGDYLKAVRDIYLNAYGLADPGLRPGRHGKIYLSRNRQKLRRVLNEEEVATWLDTHGFDLVYPELLPHPEQVLLLQGATDIIAPSGSAITNILFCQPGTRFILTGPIDQHKPFWVGLALAMGLDFTFVPGGPTGFRSGFSVKPLDLESALNETSVTT